MTKVSHSNPFSSNYVVAISLQDQSAKFDPLGMYQPLEELQEEDILFVSSKSNPNLVIEGTVKREQSRVNIVRIGCHFEVKPILRLHYHKSR
jgi:hypothetical protein